MANPAPTINQINAFNATQGTTIDFNIIGGTELVRSNRIYIYDLSDNSLICTHLYVSTESIHELPANTDSSIVYESGKSSADFVNGAQYYAQIQTYTDTAGTEGGSGLSVAKMFWCLVDPTLTITTIPSTISTTSYNVSATYTDTSASVVSNIIQQYQFNLYSAVGSLLQSSGVVVGSGTQQGTSDVYDISYNFTGLNVGSSYYVTVEVTTTQGMSVSAQSNTFTVSIDTPTLGEATVVNNACDGYISVTSNLSGEYGGSASGEIATFETDSVNDVSSLKVTLEPQQDLHGYDKPWIGGAGKNKMPTVIGGTSHGVTAVVNEDGSVTLNGTASSAAVFYSDYFTIKAGTYIITSGIPTREIVAAYLDGVSGSASEGARLTFDEDRTLRGAIQVYSGQTASNVVIYPMLRLASETDDTYEPYSNICPISGYDEVSANVVGKNLFDNKTYSGFGYNQASGTAVELTESAIVITQSENGFSYEVASAWQMVNFKTAPLKAGTYHIQVGGADSTSRISVYVVGVDGKTKGSAYNATGTTIISTNKTLLDGEYILVASGRTNAGTQTLITPQIELGSTATAYEPYQGQTYTADLPQTVYGGTVDLVSGELVIDRTIMTLDGSNDEGWYVQTSGAHHRGYTYGLTGIKPHSSNTQPTSAICDKIPTGTWIGAFGGSFVLGQTGTAIGFGLDNLEISNVSQLLAWLAENPLTVVYELATPQTYQLTPQEIRTLVGTNNVWSDSGDVEITYNIPITNLLVKRQDVADVSGTWLTLYSQPVTQASDMDFTFIDFLNQYGKTYKYALVPLLTQTQSGVEVEVEGGYTVSDEVQSIFDGVFIADSTGSQKCKANVGYGNVDMNQVVGSITPIGAKYPVVITNSQNQYHNGSISGTIVPDDYYFNGNLSRIDMVNKRNELEQFLTNKRAKIIKDWNSNIWLVMITDNIGCNFNNNYGMGMVNFNANWVEVGDPTNQQDLQATGLINVGGV